jgi:hypothetical protein
MVQKKYNEIEVKDNMKVDAEVDNNEEVVAAVEKKPLTKIVSVQPKKVKRGLFSRLITGLVGPDGLPSIGAYVNEEIIKPAVKNIIYDSITSGLSRALNMDYRNPRGHHGSVRRDNRPATNYSTKFAPSVRDREREEERRVVRSPKYAVDDYVIPERQDAAHVLVSLKENADMYDVASIADYYDLIGVPTQHTDHNYGWTIDSIVHATIMPVHGGYVIKFPPVEVI